MADNAYKHRFTIIIANNTSKHRFIKKFYLMFNIKHPLSTFMDEENENKTGTLTKKYTYKIDLKRFFYPEEWLKIYELAKPKQKYYLAALINTGARINEIRNVIKEDIDWDRATITLRITKVRTKLKERVPSPRPIAISSAYLKYLKKNFDKYKIPTTQAVDMLLKKLATKAEIKTPTDFSAHNIRKTFGTWMLALGVDGFKLAQHLGHSAEILRTKYASPDIFNFKDKDIMREILGDLPSRLRDRY